MKDRTTEYVVLPDARTVGVRLAARIADGVDHARRAGRPYILGCPGGRSLRPTYRELALELTRRGASGDRIVVAMMDDYVVEGPGGYQPIPLDSHASCARFAHEEIAGPLVAAGVTEVEVWLPDARDPSAYDELLGEAGGVDLFLLASGTTDGHVAFNPAGTDLGERTRIVRLAGSTRADNLRTFPEFASVEDVPRWGVSVGPATIRERSRELALVLCGIEKATAFERVAQADAYDEMWPATVVHAGLPATVFADVAAARGAEESRDARFR